MPDAVVPHHLDAYLPLDDATQQLFAEIQAAVRGDLDALTRRIVEQLQQVIPAYAGVGPDELFDGVAGDIARAVDAVAGGRRATAEDIAQSEEVGEERARQGVPVEALIRAFQVAAEETLALAIAHGERLGAGAHELLAFSRIGWAWANEATTAAALAHRRAELELARRDVRRRDELLRGLVLGSAPASEIQLRLPLYGMSAAGAYHVVRARPLRDREGIETAIETLRRAHASGVLIGAIDGDLVVVATRVPALPGGWCAGLGGPAEPGAIRACFDDASRALHTASSFGLAGTHRLDDLGLLPAVILDRRVGDAVADRCLGALGDDAVRQRLAETLEALLRCDLRIADAAAALFVHENTVRKRVKLFEERSGMSLSRVDDLVAVWWALRYGRARLTAAG